MALFACTFPGLATKYIEAANEDEAREKARKERLCGNDLPESNELIVTEITKKMIAEIS